MNLEEFKVLHAKFNKEGLHQRDTDTPEFNAYIDAFHYDKECSEWLMISILNERQFEYKNHCCLQMAIQISNPNTMPDGQDDHDIIMKYNEIFNEFGIPIYDGGTSVIKIEYCPWCGSKLPASQRDKWFEDLGELPFEDDSSKIPEEYKSDLWWRKTKNP